MDWYTETGEKLGAELELVADPEVDPVPMQLLPSGPGYLTIPNLRLFTGLVHRAQHKLSLTSPYFVPDDSPVGGDHHRCLPRCRSRIVRIRAG